jgi:predicted Ser/Thr protein kinase
VTIGRKIGSGSVGYVFEGKYEQHPVAIKKHKTDGTMMDHKV